MAALTQLIANIYIINLASCVSKYLLNAGWQFDIVAEISRFLMLCDQVCVITALGRLENSKAWKYTDLISVLMSALRQSNCINKCL